MRERISIPGLRGAKFSRYFPDERADIDATDDVLALVEAVEAAKALLQARPESIIAPHTLRFNFTRELYALNNSLVRFDFGEETA